MTDTPTPLEPAICPECNAPVDRRLVDNGGLLEYEYRYRAPKPTPAEPMERFTKLAAEITKVRDTVRNIALDEEACGYKEHPLHKFHLDFAVSMTRWIAMLTPEPGEETK